MTQLLKLKTNFIFFYFRAERQIPVVELVKMREIKEEFCMDNFKFKCLREQIVPKNVTRLKVKQLFL